MKTTASIITIGDEILIGQILDTNSQWIAQQLVNIGVKLIYKQSISDDKKEIITAISRAEAVSDYVFVTGGLGPTKDDITKHTLTEHFNTTLELNQPRLALLENYYKERGRVMNELNIDQAMLPKDCFIVQNEVGTACGMWFSQHNKGVISMPGVPYEMKKMMEDTIIPKIQKEATLPTIHYKTLHTIGVAESDIALIIEDWENNLPSFLTLAYLPSLGMVRLRITGYHTDEKLLRSTIEEKTSELYELIPEYIYGEDGESIEAAIGRLLKQQNKTVSTAESCTGGYVSHLITSVSGSSEYYKGSVIAYHNTVKTSILNVPTSTLETYGAVSEETTSLMAKNVCQVMETDFGIATSGIAGPTGGTPDKPIGTIWIAVSDGKNTTTRLLQLNKLREQNIRLTAVNVLNLLRKELNK